MKRAIGAQLFAKRNMDVQEPRRPGARLREAQRQSVRKPHGLRKGIAGDLCNSLMNQCENTDLTGSSPRMPLVRRGLQGRESRVQPDPWDTAHEIATYQRSAVLSRMPHLLKHSGQARNTSTLRGKGSFFIRFLARGAGCARCRMDDSPNRRSPEKEGLFAIRSLARGAGALAAGLAS